MSVAALPNRVRTSRRPRGDYKTMTRVHERNLVRRIKRGCEVSVREMLEAHDGFMWKLARHYGSVEGFNVEDALQEARIGFLHGVSRFDLSRGVRVLTYAGWWARHFVERALQNFVGDIRVPVWQQQKRGVKPIRAARLDAPVRSDEPATLLDITASNDVLPDDGAAESRRQARIKSAYQAAIATLDQRERVIAIERLSRPEPDKTTLLAIGNRFGISRERVRQIERVVATKLRLRLAKLGGKKLLAA